MAIAAIGVSIAGCGRKDAPPAAAPQAAVSQPGAPAAVSPAQPPGDFKAALVMSGPKSDNGWNSGASKALESVKSNLELSDDAVKSVDNQTDAANQAKSLEDFAAKKFTVVFGHGTEYEAPALKIESSFPNTLFVISAGSKVGKNTTPIIIKLEDGAYLEGMLAAGISKTNTVASVGATKDESHEHVFAAFEKGAKTVNPKITVIPPAYTGSWDDVTKAKQQTLALLNQGADVIMQDVDLGGSGHLQRRGGVQQERQAGVGAGDKRKPERSSAGRNPGIRSYLY